MDAFAAIVRMVAQRSGGHWKLLSALVAGVVLSSGLMACVFLYSDAIRDLGLAYALDSKKPLDLDIRIQTSTTNLNVDDDQRRQATTERTLKSLAGDVVVRTIRYGRSATFFLTAEGGTVPTRDDRPRAHFQYMEDLDENTRVVEGRRPSDPAGAGGAGLEMEVAIGKAGAEALGVKVGDKFDLHPHWRPGTQPVRVVVTGIVEPEKADDRYWGGREDLFIVNTPQWPTYGFFVSERAMVTGLGGFLPDADGTFETHALVDTERINSSNAKKIEDGVGALERVIKEQLPDSYVRTVLPETLEGYRERLFFTRLPLFALMLQVVGIALFYLAMVSTMVVDREVGEIALLKSRGASTAQIMVVFALEGLGIAAVATVVGPLLAAAAISVLGLTPPFFDLSGGSLLEVRLTLQAFVLAAFGALLAIAAMLWPAYKACALSITNYKQQISRPQRQSAFLRYYLDLALLGAGAFAFYQLRQRGSLVTENLFGGLSADPLLLITPSLFMLMIALVFLRLFPLALRLAAWATAPIEGPAISLALTRMVRSPLQHSRLILLIILTTAVGMFAAGFRATLERSYEDRAAYAAGAAGRLEDIRQPFNVANSAVIGAVKTATGTEDVSAVARYDATYNVSRFRSQTLDFMAVEPEAFGDMLFWRDDFAADGAGQLLALTKPDWTVDSGKGAQVPGGVTELRMWAQMPQPPQLPANAWTMGIRAQSSSTGLFYDYRLVPQADTRTADGWQLYVADLTRPGAQRTSSPPPGGLVVDSVWVRLQGQQPQVKETHLAVFDDILTADGRVIESWDDLSGYEVVSGAADVPDVGAMARGEASGSRSGGVVRLTFLRGLGSAPVSGVRRDLGIGPLPVLVANEFLAEYDLKLGDEVRLYLNRQYVQVRLAGSFDLFPTYNPERNRPLMVADLQAAQVAAARVPTMAEAMYVNGAWLGDTGSGTLDKEKLATLGLRVERVLDLEQVRAQQSSDPLVAASWEGILFLSFGAVLILSALGFVMYSSLSAKARSLEFALLRTMGFSGRQILSVVTFEQCFVIVAGVAAGTLLGFPLSRLMIGYLGLTEDGSAPLPPLVSQISGQAVATVYISLGVVVVSTVVALVVLYSRLAVGRALRMGEL